MELPAYFLSLGRGSVRRVVNGTLGFRASHVIPWYQSLGKQLPRELGCGYPQVWS